MNGLPSTLSIVEALVEIKSVLVAVLEELRLLNKGKK